MLKIANAPGISINLFIIFDIETDFEAEQDEERNFIPATMKISFKDKSINKKLCTYLKAKQLQEKIENDTQNFTDEAQHQETVTDVATELEDIKNHFGR